VREPPTPLAEFTPAFGVVQAWSADIGGGTKDYPGLLPTIRDATVYAAGANGRVSAFAVDSGKPRWQVDLNVPISGAVGVGQSLVAVGTRDGRVIALARDTGEQRWVAKVSSEVLAPPAIGDSIVVAQTVDGRLVGLAIADGKLLWVYERAEPALSLRGADAPILVPNAVLAGFASGRLAAVRLDDGQALWEIPVALPRGRNEIERLVDVDVAPLVFSDAIYAASFQGKLVALNPSNGNVLWSRDISTHTGIASDGTNLYVTNDRGYVLAFDLAMARACGAGGLCAAAECARNTTTLPWSRTRHGRHARTSRATRLARRFVPRHTPMNAFVVACRYASALR
jgi:outer membrane protein assembly factor BamB